MHGAEVYDVCARHKEERLEQLYDCASEGNKIGRIGSPHQKKGLD